MKLLRDVGKATGNRAEMDSFPAVKRDTYQTWMVWAAIWGGDQQNDRG